MKLMNNLILAKIIKGKFKGTEVLMPRIPIIPADLPFHFKRIQFPVRLAFAMAINKSHGQSLEVVGLISNFLVFRMVSYTLTVPVLTNRLRGLF